MARGPGRPKDPISREALIGAARTAFAEHGYLGTSMSRIADASGLRKASLFHHFSNKEALYLEVLQATLGDLGQLVASAGPGDGEWTERLAKMSDLVTDYLGHRPGAARLLLREVMDQGPFAGGPGGSAVLGTLEMLAAFVQSGMDEGAIPVQDPRHLAISITSVHLLWFSTDVVTGPFVGGSVYDPATLEARREAVLQHVRALCGLA